MCTLHCTALYSVSSHSLLWLCVLSQHGIFAWIPLPAFQKVGAVLWIVPILAFSLCVGIGLEYVSSTTLAAVARVSHTHDLLGVVVTYSYDIFLLVAIEEARRIKRLDHKSAIVVGMCETGSVITSGKQVCGPFPHVYESH